MLKLATDSVLQVYWLAGEKGEGARADWAHVYLSVLPQLPLSAPADEARIVAALRAAGARMMARYGAGLRRAAVAQWEVRLPVPDASGAWRLVVSSPTGKGRLLVIVRAWSILLMQPAEGFVNSDVHALQSSG